MRHTITSQIIEVIGYIWQPGTGICAMRYTLSDFDLSNMDPHDRDDVERWLMLHSGDFREISDFRADFHIGDESVIHEWGKGEESEFAFSDAMYPSED